jgi:hypothetical protein
MKGQPSGRPFLLSYQCLREASNDKGRLESRPRLDWVKDFLSLSRDPEQRRGSRNCPLRMHCRRSGTADRDGRRPAHIRGCRCRGRQGDQVRDHRPSRGQVHQGSRDAVAGQAGDIRHRPRSGSLGHAPRTGWAKSRAGRCDRRTRARRSGDKPAVRAAAREDRAGTDVGRPLRRRSPTGSTEEQAKHLPILRKETTYRASSLGEGEETSSLSEKCYRCPVVGATDLTRRDGYRGLPLPRMLRR